MAFSTASAHADLQADINITPLVDVMLVLMVVFLLTAPLLNNAVKIRLPKTAATAPPHTPKAVTVSVNDQGRLFIDRRAVADAQLEPELRTLAARNPELAVSLQADESVPYKSVAQAMAAISRSGISKLSVITAPAAH